MELKVLGQERPEARAVAGVEGGEHGRVRRRDQGLEVGRRGFLGDGGRSAEHERCGGCDQGAPLGAGLRLRRGHPGLHAEITQDEVAGQATWSCVFRVSE